MTIDYKKTQVRKILNYLTTVVHDEVKWTYGYSLPGR